MTRSSLARRYTFIALVVGAAGCGDNGAPTPDGSDSPIADGRMDTGDGGRDTPADLAVDANHDTPVDAGHDTPVDVAIDQGADLGNNTGDAGGDGSIDALPVLKKLVLLQTNDLHSYLQGHDPEVDYTPATINDDITTGGLSRLAARVTSERAAAGATPVMLLDSGDFMMGTAFELVATTLSAELSEMQQLGYDAITLGNHEFDWTPTGLAKIVSNATILGFTVPIVATNLQNASTDLGARYVKAIVKTKLVKTLPNGIKVGIFGLLGQNAVAVTPTVAPLTFDPIATAATAIVQELRTQDQVDVIIALSHSGINQAGAGEDAVLAAAVPDIDVILSGHTHDALTTAVKVGKTIITQTGRYGEHLGKLALTVSKSASATTVTLDSYDLLPVDDSVAGDTAMQTRIGGYETAISTALAPAGLSYLKTLAKTTVDIPGGAGETPIGDLVTDSYRTVVSALTPTAPPAVAIDAAGAIRARLAKGTTGVVSFADMFRVLPLGIGPDGLPGYPLVTFYLNGVDLRAGMEFSAASTNSDYVLQVSGLEVHLDGTQPPFHRVTSIKVGGTAIDLTDTTTCYKTTTTLYVAGLLGLVGQATGGALAVVPKDQDCATTIADMTSRIVRQGATAAAPELKAWQALTSFLTMLPQDAGVPAIPAIYGASQGRVTSP
jgi:5'-nucleotidase / UDP-sugar diphosphatase